MATDVKLDQGDGSWVVIDAAATKLTGTDFMLDSPVRRKAQNPYRRALVHDATDGLTVNYSKDYPGGVTIGSATTIVGDLVVRGNISYLVSGVKAVGSGTVFIPQDLVSELSELQLQVHRLTERIEKLESGT